MKIVSQFKGLTITGWTDEYLLTTNLEFSDAVERIVQFINGESATVGKDFEGNIAIERGSVIGTWLSPTEKTPKQTITILEQDNGILLRYHILFGLFLRLPPYGLEKEAEKIEQLL